MVSSLPNKIYLLENFYGFMMNSSKTLEQNLDTFNKLQLDLCNTRKKFDDEDVAVILLNSLTKSFEDVKTTIKYGKYSFSSVIVIMLSIREILLLESRGTRSVQPMEMDCFLGEGLKTRAETTREEAKAGAYHNQNQSLGMVVMATRILMEVIATMVARLATIVGKKNTSKGIATSG